MTRFLKLKLILPLLPLFIVASAIVGPLVGNAYAQSGLTLNLTLPKTGKLDIARTVVVITVKATCTVPAGSGWTFAGGFGDVLLSQVTQGKTMTSQGTFDLTTCDGTTQSIQVAVPSTTGSAPFHAGPATITFADLFGDYFDTNGNLQQSSMFVRNPQSILITVSRK